MAEEGQTWMANGIFVTEDAAARLLEVATPVEVDAIVSELVADPAADPNVVVTNTVAQ